VLQKKAVTEWAGVRLVPYQPARGSSSTVHPWLSDLETKTIRAEAVFNTALQLKKSGFNPDVIIAHPGWGESLFVKNVWPATKLGMYCEFFYHAEGADVGFDPEFSNPNPAEICRLQMKNANNILHFQIADAGISPTHWQASTFPASFREKMTVVHDGIDTQAIIPNPAVSLNFNQQLTLTRNDEVITFVNRNLEPYRGYHIFMRMLPELLARRPRARILIVGGDNVSYGAAPKDGETWKAIFFNEVKAKISAADWARVLFLGNISYQHFIPLLQISTVHVYLTYPFVLSWSVFEAMSAGCAVVASNTQPLHEAITDNETGMLVDFFAIESWVEKISQLLDNPEQRAYLGKNARIFAQTHYDLQTVCLPKQLAWVKQLAEL
jgi:glycosyltransferase involved in cell wall biosynthesis